MKACNKGTNNCIFLGKVYNGADVSFYAKILIPPFQDGSSYELKLQAEDGTAEAISKPFKVAKKC